MMYEELRCIHCGGRLILEAVSDDMGCDQALDFSAESHDWEYLIALSCCGCGMQYPIARTDSPERISKIKVVRYD